MQDENGAPTLGRYRRSSFVVLLPVGDEEDPTTLRGVDRRSGFVAGAGFEAALLFKPTGGIKKIGIEKNI